MSDATESTAPATEEHITEAEERGVTWRRAHPLSPLVRSWVLVLAFLIAFVRPVLEEVFTGQNTIALEDLRSIPTPDTFLLSWLEIFGSYWFFAATFLIFAVLIGSFFISWFFYRFAVDSSNLYIKSGILFRTERKARLDRVQSIDVNRSLLARILGLAELKFDVADGAESALKVQYLKYRDARELRDELLVQVRDLKNGQRSPSQAPADGEKAEAGSSHLRDRLTQHVTENFVGVKGEGEEQIVHVPVGRLLGSMALSLGTIFALLGALTTLALMFWLELGFGAMFASNVGLILGIGATVWNRLNNGFNFRLSTSPDGLKTRFGLTDTVTKTLPEGRIQAITVTQPLLWRMAGWYRVRVSLAGQGDNEDGAFAGELLPVGTRADLLRILPLVVTDEAHGGAKAEQLQAGLDAKGSGHGFTATRLTEKRRIDWFALSRNAFSVTPALLLVRAGVTTKKLTIIPHVKIQQLELTQGPLGKRYGFADMALSTAGGMGARTDLSFVDTEVARALLVREAQLGLSKN